MQKLLFVDRDGTLIRESPDEQIDCLERLALMPEVIPSLLQLRDAGYHFVMITNQDGLGSEAFPQEAFDRTQAAMLELFTSQGITFDEILICPHLPNDDCRCRKPHLGLVRHILQRDGVDWARSWVVGDRDTDMELAQNMGIQSIRVKESGEDGESWPAIVRKLLSAAREAEYVRETHETNVTVRVDLDQYTKETISTGIGFFDHMLEQLAKHGAFALSLQVKGDLEVDDHHTVEDVGLALGQTLRRAVGDKVGVARYGFVLPMDDARAEVLVDLSGRPYLVFEGEFKRERVGEMATELVPHFFRSLVGELGATLHIKMQGDNAHHAIEAVFKATGRVLRQAFARTSETTVPSTKGSL